MHITTLFPSGELADPGRRPSRRFGGGGLTANIKQLLVEQNGEV